MVDKKGVLDRLSHISTVELSIKQIDAYQREIIEVANPRGAAILLAVHVENALEVTLERRLKIGNYHLNSARIGGMPCPANVATLPLPRLRLG